MKFRNPFKSKIKHLLSKEAEYQLYKKAADDIEANIIDKGIWTKAFAQANGDEVKQKALLQTRFFWGSLCLFVNQFYCDK